MIARVALFALVTLCVASLVLSQDVAVSPSIDNILQETAKSCWAASSTMLLNYVTLKKGGTETHTRDKYGVKDLQGRLPKEQPNLYSRYMTLQDADKPVIDKVAKILGAKVLPTSEVLRWSLATWRKHLAHAPVAVGTWTFKEPTGPHMNVVVGVKGGKLVANDPQMEDHRLYTLSELHAAMNKGLEKSKELSTPLDFGAMVLSDPLSILPVAPKTTSSISSSTTSRDSEDGKSSRGSGGGWVAVRFLQGTTVKTCHVSPILDNPGINTKTLNYDPSKKNSPDRVFLYVTSLPRKFKIICVPQLGTKYISLSLTHATGWHKHAPLSFAGGKKLIVETNYWTKEEWDKLEAKKK